MSQYKQLVLCNALPCATQWHPPTAASHLGCWYAGTTHSRSGTHQTDIRQSREAATTRVFSGKEIYDKIDLQAHWEHISSICNILKFDPHKMFKYKNCLRNK